MATITYYNDNQGVYFLRDLFDYQYTALSETEVILTYDAALLGTFNPGRHAWQYKLTLANSEIDFVDDPSVPGDFDFTGGTLTRIQAYDQSNTEVWDMNGLTAQLSLLSHFANTQESWAASNYIYSGTHDITGSEDGGNTIDGWDGDNIRTGWGDDSVSAGKGNDYIEDRGGSDYYRGGKGSDTVAYNSAFYDPQFAVQGVYADLNAGTATGTDGEVDTLVSIERIYGSFLDDTLLGNSEDNRFRGMQGDDTINGRGGFDVLDYRRDADQGGRFGIRANLKEGTVRDGFHDDDTVIKMEAIRGTSFKDVMRDNGSDNYLQGNGGRDYLQVSGGNDTLEGGDDVDRFIFLGNGFDDDLIYDFEDGIDMIKIDKAPNMAALTITDDGTNSLIQWNGNSITVLNTLSGDLTSDDFIF